MEETNGICCCIDDSQRHRCTIWYSDLMSVYNQHNVDLQLKKITGEKEKKMQAVADSLNKNICVVYIDGNANASILS